MKQKSTLLILHAVGHWELNILQNLLFILIKSTEKFQGKICVQIVINAVCLWEFIQIEIEHINILWIRFQKPWDIQTDWCKLSFDSIG